MSKASKYAVSVTDLAVGEYVYEFSLDDRFFEEYGGELSAGECDVEIVLTKGGSLTSLRTKIDGKVKVVCDRCLDEFYMPVNFDGVLDIKVGYGKEGYGTEEYDLDSEEEFDRETMWIAPDADTIDLSGYLYESVYLSLPMQKVHPKGKCNPDMLARFVQAPDEEEDVEDED